MSVISDKEVVVGVVGLGYVGLPLAIEFSRQFKVVGYDIDHDRISAIERGVDHTGEVEKDSLVGQVNLKVTSEQSDLAQVNFYVVTVPTPVNSQRAPDLTMLESACFIIGSNLNDGDVVVFESTVYPGATEEVCVPILVEQSGLSYNSQFRVAYSPERINPGDRSSSLTEIVKVVGSDDEECLSFVASVYSKIISEIHQVSSLKVAEAAKVLENTQRDLNIALMNEMAIICDLLKIDTKAVIDAAATKWNFAKFQPGLVGGHCIGVDPYYLAAKAVEVGHVPDVLLAGRRLNDSMPAHICKRVIRAFLSNTTAEATKSVLILGYTFKENCPDIRNTKVQDLCLELRDSGFMVDIHDPWVSSHPLDKQGIGFVEHVEFNHYSVVVLAVAHEIFLQKYTEDIALVAKRGGIVFDVKGCLSRDLPIFTL